MRITSIELENFGPFGGTHRVDLASGAAPVTLFHGENMTGKTSLLNAARWCLYGYAKNRLGGETPTRELINYDAQAAGTCRVSVRLTIEDDVDGATRQIHLRRKRQARPGIEDAESEKDFEDFKDVEIDGQQLAPHMFDDIVVELLPEEISRFFLFDGELLSEYEELVRDVESIQGRKVREAIESILGVPAVVDCRDDIKNVRESTERKYRREASKHDVASAAAHNLGLLKEEEESIQADKRDLEETFKRLDRELSSLDEQLKGFADVKEDALRRAEAEQRLHDIEGEEKETIRRRQGHVGALWRDALYPRVAAEIERLEKERDVVQAALGEKQVLSRRRKDLEEALKKETCETCGQRVQEEQKAHIRREIGELDQELALLDGRASTERAEELIGTVRALRETVPAGVVQAIGELEDRLKEIGTERFRLKKRIQSINERIQDVDHTKIVELEEERTRKIEARGQCVQSLEKVEASLEENRRRREQERRTIEEHNVPALEYYESQLRVLEGLERVFEGAVDEYVQQLRDDVQREASEIFSRLISQKAHYSGLQINERFGLSLLDADGRVVERSAGAEQVVALSLIGALNRLATKRGPLWMDTPFGRLDRTHRANILAFLPTLADELVLFVHSGEIDHARDVAVIQGRVGREYTIEQKQATQSEILEGAPT
jgi:DNA sulfur modification protein DndD